METVEAVKVCSHEMCGHKYGFARCGVAEAKERDAHIAETRQRERVEEARRAQEAKLAAQTARKLKASERRKAKLEQDAEKRAERALLREAKRAAKVEGEVLDAEVKEIYNRKKHQLADLKEVAEQRLIRLVKEVDSLTVPVKVRRAIIQEVKLHFKFRGYAERNLAIEAACEFLERAIKNPRSIYSDIKTAAAVKV